MYWIKEVDLKRSISLRMRFIYYSLLVCEKSTLFFILWACASSSYFCGYFIKSHTGFIILPSPTICLELSKKNPDKIKCPKTNRLSSTSGAACARFCFLNSLSLFVFPPSSGLTPSQYAVSVLERKSQIGTSGQKSCCPVQTVGAVVSRFSFWMFSQAITCCSLDKTVVCAC